MVQRSAQEDIALSVGESISAAVDGEMNDLDLRRILNESTDDAVRAKWRQSHLIGAALRGELDEQNTVDISSGIWAALENEAPLKVSGASQAPFSERFNKLFSLAGKSAVAASVALAMLVGVQYLPQNSSEPSESVVADTEELPVSPIVDSIPAGFDAPRVNARVVSTDTSRNRNVATYRNEPFILPVPEAPRAASDPKVQAYLNNLLLIHAQQSSQASVIGVLPYVRVLHPSKNESE